MRKIILTTTLASLVLAPTPVLARTYSAWAVRTTMMRAGPDYDYPPVQRIRRNSQVAIFGCLNDWSWCDVGYRYDRGWVAGRDLVANYRGRRQGISSYLGISILSFIFGNYWDSHYRGRTFYNERSRWEQHYYDNYQPHWGPRPNIPQVYQNRTRANPPLVRTQPRGTVTPKVQPMPDRNRNMPGANQKRRGTVTPKVQPIPDRNRNIPGANQKRRTMTTVPQGKAGPQAPVRNPDKKNNKANKKVRRVDQTKPH